ncbi:ABC-type transporter, periplasmic subunit family 3 [Mycolicibacterium canariasense]|uniref:ABC-type transporter, periplasmic subunit family 3 n=1 Tax=Mycolicibacterium canariasense TaxID=228230 RepID=A0A100WHA2_MYCCR|nr:ABC-type transporter, periplasmic subunit family 3 [Mycolicibacterium canariasense]
MDGNVVRVGRVGAVAVMDGPVHQAVAAATSADAETGAPLPGAGNVVQVADDAG